MRKEFEMTEEDLEDLLKAAEPVPLIMLHIPGANPTPQERANRVWQRLGNKMGFEFMSVQPSNKGDRFFTAESRESEVMKEKE